MRQLLGPRALACAALVCIVVCTSALQAQDPCPRATLPAYAHNDYENPRPLHDALALGYRGVEVDLFLVSDTLRVGHDRRAAARGAAFDALYLRPMDAIVARCGSLTADSLPFLLTIELKTASPNTFARLRELLASYPRLFRASGSAPATGDGSAPAGALATTPATTLATAPASASAGALATAPMEVVLVGWHPPLDRFALEDTLFGVQRKLTEQGVIPDAPLNPRIRLLSLDYGKTLGRWWRTERGRAQWMITLRAVALAHPTKRIRVFNAPNDAQTLSALLDAGATLIGTKSLARTQRALTAGRLE